MQALGKSIYRPSLRIVLLDIETLLPISLRAVRNGFSTEAPRVSIFDASLPVCHVGRHWSKSDEIKKGAGAWRRQSSEASTSQLNGLIFAEADGEKFVELTSLAKRVQKKQGDRALAAVWRRLVH